MPRSDRAKISQEYVSLIATYVQRNYGPKGVLVHEQVNLGTSIIGKKRRLDVLVIDKSTQKALGLKESA